MASGPSAIRRIDRRVTPVPRGSTHDGPSCVLTLSVGLPCCRLSLPSQWRLGCVGKTRNKCSTDFSRLTPFFCVRSVS